MKQYKHIATGDIAELISANGYKLNRSTIGLIPKEYIENSNDWEEVKEKEWAITSFVKENKFWTEDRINGLFSDNDNDKYEGNGYDLKEMIRRNFTIYSVKRLSDGAEFKIGKKYHYGKHHFLITGFHIVNDLVFAEDNTHGYNIDLLDLKFLKKEKLFTTEDGVDIYDKDDYWYYWENYTGNSKFNPINYNKFQALADGEEDYESELGSRLCFRFSTFEAVTEYIIMNKPCLSYKEVVNIYTGTLKNNYKLRKLVKSKI